MSDHPEHVHPDGATFPVRMRTDNVEELVDAERYDPATADLDDVEAFLLSAGQRSAEVAGAIAHLSAELRQLEALRQASVARLIKERASN